MNHQSPLTHPIAKIENLTISLPTPGGLLTAVKDLSLALGPRETLGIVGESGSGKSMTALALMGLLPPGAIVQADRMRVGGADILSMSDRQLSADIRGAKAAMIFQEPMTTLNPVYSIGRQLTETMTVHGGTHSAARERAIELLNAVGLSNPEDRFNQYPHQFSGGQRQRILIAMALMNSPDLLIADEPTTALDVTIQAQILDLLKDLREKLGIAVILITHDFGVLANHADRVMVMLKGEVVETGQTRNVLRDPQHDYTKRLIGSLPKAHSRPPRPSGKVLIEAMGLSQTYHFRRALFAPTRKIEAVKDVSFKLGEGETLAVVGESGSGKSTLARMVLGLETSTQGRVSLDGKDISSVPEPVRARLIQPIFQDPYGSLNPRMPVNQIIRRPLDIHGIGTKTERIARTREVMEQTGLSPRFFHAFPNQMSGGQRQRVAIARALILQPRIILCDEPTSALDVSIQAQILTLLEGLRDQLNLTLLLITHDLGVVRQMADRVIVMQQGQIVEEGVTADLFAAPTQEYTRTLLASVPTL
ncbi:ABC transporter ATP-binding protein [uncultured Tateyamaria sp.]|uniref:ABC transporter ATP-binding protein n=1 Tax=uncultured Tateyamaria sp. TaxID=455651 RepID=UPI002631726F|nr:ABC transporter ATP-binding protein [uncultured Tateyamaria sp.]